MDGGARETRCSSCSHRDVCAHKDDYLNMIKSLEEMFYKFPENEREKIPKAVEDGRKSCAKMIKESAQKYDEKTDI